MHGVAEKQVTKEQRQGAKAINFGTIYGAGGAGLAASAWNSYSIALSVEEAQAARDRFLSRYRMLATWMRSNADSCQRNGLIEVGRYGRVIRAEWEHGKDHQSSGGHRRSYSNGGDDDYVAYDDDDEDDEVRDDDEDLAAFYVNEHGHQLPGSNSNYNRSPPSTLKFTLCCNAPVQGACADIVMRAMTLIDHALTAAGIDGGLVLAVHDELVLEVPEAQAEDAAKLLAAAMTQAFAEYLPPRRSTSWWSCTSSTHGAKQSN